jgi:hypothetical protein
MQKKNFITTTDAETANKLIVGGFQLLSQSGGVYVFMNSAPQHFNFENIDVKKLAYTNTLVF